MYTGSFPEPTGYFLNYTIFGQFEADLLEKSMFQQLWITTPENPFLGKYPAIIAVVQN